MAMSLKVQWVVTPISPPQPVLHCATCKTARHFRSSGSVRMNANGKRMDVWLIYRCLTCDRSWNRPLAERVPITDLCPDDFEAMQQNNPDWVRAREFDVAALRRVTDRICHPTDIHVARDAVSESRPDWSELELDLIATWPTGMRLDRFLAAELHLSRSRLQKMVCAGHLICDPVSRNGLRGSLNAAMQVRFSGAAFTAKERALMMHRLFEQK